MEGNMQFSTPRKNIKRGKQQVCVACAKASADARNLSNSPSKKKKVCCHYFFATGALIFQRDIYVVHAKQGY